MPDWSYQTLFRPLLLRMAPEAARDLSLGAMGTLARSPFGPTLIDLLGHMGPDPRLRRTRLGIEFSSAVGLGAGIDIAGMAAPAFERFGFGFLEIGPVTARPLQGAGPLTRDAVREAIEAPDPPDNPGAVALAARLARDGPRRVPILARLAPMPGTSPTEIVDEFLTMAGILAPHVSALSLSIPIPLGGDDAPPAHLGDVVRAVRSAAPGRPVLICLPADLDPNAASRWAEAARAEGVDGLIVDGGLRVEGDRRRMGVEARGPALNLVRRLRDLWEGGVVIASGGVHEPVDALRLLAAGADLVLIDTGIVFAGPGLPKRVNDATLAFEHGPGRSSSDPSPARPARMTWFWALLMGLGMLLGSLLALAIAATRVVLPYDEWFVGLSRAELAAINPRLLGFMTHDRVTLAGVMTTLGVLYCGLSLFGIRRGQHWAMVAVVASASVGFGSFFLFLGYGYLDPLHAFVTVVLLQFLLLAIHSDLAPPEVPERPGLFNDRAWRLGLGGQLLVIIQASLFLMAGAVISLVGITRVFVPEDLAYMHATAESLAAAGPRLVPLVAHDRACLGGMLVCSGIGYLLPALWGYRRGSRWLWWTLTLAAIPGFAATIAVHLAVGYTDVHHLLPAFLGAALLAAGLGLSRPYLRGGDAATDIAWEQLRGRVDPGEPTVDASR
jgi:dihydroorotate dehydrogenase